jgi:hypothetical protein
VLISEPLPFVKAFVAELDAALRAHRASARGLSALQRRWLGFCLMAMMVTNSLCWRRFERAGLGRYSQAALSWVFCHAKLPWEVLLQHSVGVILRQHGIGAGSLILDDTDKRRSKVTRRIARVHKLKDKTSGGFVMGQCLVFLLLVSERITVPVGVAFYEPDPVRRAWVKQDKKLKQQGLAKGQRPPEPPRNPAYPTKPELGLRLLEQFRQWQPTVTVQCVLADALYGMAAFMDPAGAVFDGVQVISQLRGNQKVRFRNRSLSLEQYFDRYAGVVQSYRRRGGQPITVWVSSARLFVEAHGKKRFVIALKYEGESEYRYLVASDLSWRTEDIVQAFTLRWLVEVFIQDWKGYEGWGALTKQPGEEGSSRGLILSLLVDHCLLLHPAQLAQLNHRQPAFTVGSLINRIKVDSLLEVFRGILATADPAGQLQQLSDTLAECFDLRPSEKHMVGRDLGRLASSPSLKYKAAAAT